MRENEDDLAERLKFGTSTTTMRCLFLHKNHPIHINNKFGHESHGTVVHFGGAFAFICVCTCVCVRLCVCDLFGQRPLREPEGMQPCMFHLYVRPYVPPKAPRRLTQASQNLAQVTQRLAQATQRLAQATQRLAQASQRLAQASQRLAQASQRLIQLS